MNKGARVTPPSGIDTAPVKIETYRIRGETVAVGGTVEWIIGILATRFAASTRQEPKRRWNDLKTHLAAQSLARGLSDPIGAVSNYFKPRGLAAHSALLIISTGQIARLLRDGGVEFVTLDDLRVECATARAGYKAIQTIGRALDANQPAVLANMGTLPRAILLGAP